MQHKAGDMGMFSARLAEPRDAEDGRTTPAVLETRCLHSGAAQTVLECVSSAAFAGGGSETEKCEAKE